jgi:hypothetical protein
MEQQNLQNRQQFNPLKGFVIITAMIFLIPFVIPDMKHRIETLEICIVIIIPLFIFYMRCNWSPKMLSLNIPILVLLWFFSYAMLHELSHLIGIIIIGDKIIDYHLLPKFWEAILNIKVGLNHSFCTIGVMCYQDYFLISEISFF